MYSEREKNQIKNYERTGFRELKKEENKNKTIPKSSDIEYTSNFTLEDFSNEGDSGKLYLATNKHNKDEKYIIKHEYYDCACNEYMYSKIANKMGIKVAPVKLFIIKEKKFKSDFVSGAKYLEGCHRVYADEVLENKDSIKNWKDYFRMVTLVSLFEESDGFEIVKYEDAIYRIDTAAAFKLSDFDIYPLAYDYNGYGVNVREYASTKLLKKAQRELDKRIHEWTSEMNDFIKRYGEEYRDIFLETFSLLKKVTEQDIEEWCSILTLFYPDIMGEYFKIYFSNLKLDVEAFLIKVNEENLITN